MDDSEVTTKDEKQKNDTSRELEEELSKGDSESKLRVIKRKYLQLLEDFEYQFTGACTALSLSLSYYTDPRDG